MTIAGRLALVVSVSALATPAFAGVWDDFIRPAETNWRQPSTAVPCPRIGTQNLSAADEAVILDVAVQVCETMEDPRFAALVRAEPAWLANCEAEGRPGQSVTADEVLTAIMPRSIPFSIVAKKPWRAVAVTNLHYDAIAIRKQRFAGWRSGSIARRQAMVETLAHEMTHLIPESPDSIRSRFRDEDHVERVRPGSTEPRCYNNLLVSYEIGRIAGELWRVRQAETAR